MTAEDQIPIVEVDDSYSSSLMQDFLWFTKVQNVVSKLLRKDLKIFICLQVLRASFCFCLCSTET